LLSLPVGSRIQYRLENRSSYPLYIVLLGLDSSGNLTALYAPPAQPAEPSTAKPASPVDAAHSDEASTAPPPSTSKGVAPGEVLTLPRSFPNFEWTLNGPPGLAETYLICSRAPLTQTQTVLEAALHGVGNNPAFYPLPNPLEVAQAVLQDLHQASDTAVQAVGTSSDTFVLDVNNWASLHFVYQIV
jgi:hypothetical protein